MNPRSTSGPASSPPPIGLYVHVPFCVSKCAYCDFVSYAGREADIPRYVETVVREIARRGAETGRPRADTVFLGGGTPSLLDEAQVTRILEALFEAFAIEDGAEITCECNPGTLGPHPAHRLRSLSQRDDSPHPGHRLRSLSQRDDSPHPGHRLRSLSQRERGVVGGTLGTSFAQALRKAGVNRLSIGAQAAQTRLLRLLGRIHDWKQVVASVEVAHNAGFDNINLDLMLALPSQTISDLRETLEATVALSPAHLACYSLIVEDRTPISRDIAAGRLALPDEELDREMYELARRTLTEHGFQQYEISNFARPGFECRHNIGCWTRVPYLGFGSAAHSFFDERRTMNPPSLDAYLSGEKPKTEPVSKEEARFESLMLGLRMTRGVKDDEFTRMHGLSIREAFGEKLDRPIAAGLLEWHEGALRLTRRGMDLENAVLVDLM